jgi:hypothetical protein
MAHVQVTRSAEPDLAEGQVFHQRQQASAGEYFLDGLLADIDARVLYAGSHSGPNGRLHRSLSDRSPFAIHEELQGHVATVVAVLDCRRYPASITQPFG